MNLPTILPSESPKSKQINIRLTEGQAKELKRYCTRHNLNANTVVLAALCAMIEGFDKV